MGVILRFDGESWSRVRNESPRTLFTVHGNESQVVATGGSGEAVIGEIRVGQFVHITGSGIAQLNGVFTRQGARGVAVGNEASVAFQTELGWEPQDIGVEDSRDLHAVWVDPDGGIWAVGGNLSAALDQGLVLYIGEESVRTYVRVD